MEMEPETEMQQFEECCASTITKWPSRIIKHCGQAVHDIIEAKGPGQGGGCSSRNSDSEHLIGEECNKSIHSTSFDNRYEENSMSIPGDVLATVPRSLWWSALGEELRQAIQVLDLATASDLHRTIARRRALDEERRKAFEEEKWKVLLMSAVALVYQYLIGYIDIGGTKTYSSSSLEFRPTYVSIVLFQGAYVWIKFRDAAPSGYRRIIKSKSSGATRLAPRLEVRYKPPRRSGVNNHIHLCMCDTEEEATIYKKIAGRYYDERNDGKLDLGNDDFFVIPPMPIEEQALSVSKKIEWVQGKVKEVYEDFLKAKDARSQPDIANNTDGAGDHGDTADPFGISVDDYFLEGDFEMLDVLLQEHFHDNNSRESPSAAVPMVDDLNPPGTESVETHSDLRLEGILNVVQEACVVGATVNEVSDGEGALHDSQTSESPFKSPVLTIQGGSDTMTLHLDKIAPSFTNLGPPVPTPDLLLSLAQHIQERDGKIEEQKQQIEEQKQLINFLKLQHEELKQQHEGLKQQINSLVQ